MPTDITVVTGNNGEIKLESVEPTPYTPGNVNTGKQQHGNPQIAICAGGNLHPTPGATLP